MAPRTLTLALGIFSRCVVRAIRMQIREVERRRALRSKRAPAVAANKKITKKPRCSVQSVASVRRMASVPRPP
jgi:hypothetical protein